MKIYFCDICNESIPLKDINSNRITIEEGKIFCQKCAPRKAKAGERIPGTVMAALGVLALVVAVGGTMGWKSMNAQANELAELRASLDLMDRDLGMVPAQVSALSSQVKSLEGELSKVRDDLTVARTELQRRFQGLDERERSNDEQLKRETQEALQRGIGGLATQLLNVEQRVGSLREQAAGDNKRIESLEGRLATLYDILIERNNPAPTGAEGSGTEVGAGTSGAPSPDALEEKEINAHISALSDGDPGKRYSAVIALNRYTGDKVATALVGLIKDPEDYVRVAVIQNLRKLGAKSTIPHIIEALRDGDYFVRLAARGAVRSLAEATLNFDPDASAGDRETQVKAWERWWLDNKDRILKAAGGS
jgi:hypothetical protein